ncbi:MAG: hypothetical protein K2P81_06915 [Bacteriovoracaceae bacterium]|nr:hypothetical protein [Bacteriovoracaceae bacterium]
MKNLALSMAVLALVAVGCSSKRKVKEVDNTETIKKDFEVRDASSNFRPAWIEDAEVWSEQEKKDDNWRWFAFETEPKVNREIACNLAKANARADIAGEITTFIQKTLAESTEGQAAIDPSNPKTQPLRDYVSNTLAERVQSLIHGSAVTKTYWEKRQFVKEMGAKKDYIGFTCAVLVRMDKKVLKDAIDKASEEVVNKAADPEVKENVKKALDKVDEDFLKARKGEV